MPCSATIEEAVTLAEARWPGYEFKIKNGEEACGPCPICGQATEDGCIIFSTGFYYCRPGSHQGWLDEENPPKLTVDQLALRKVIAEQKRQQRHEEEVLRRLTAIERLNRSNDHLIYHQCLDENDRAWWHSQGISDPAIDEYELGVCFSCPTDVQHRPSYTLPVHASTGELIMLQHRLIGNVQGDRYRPHLVGLPGKVLFNSRFCVNGNKEAMILEGVKKAICVSQYGYPAMAVLNKTGFDLSWLKKFTVKRLVLVPDPDAADAWERLGSEIAQEGFSVYVAHLPVKPDDFLIDGGTVADFDGYLRWAKKVH